MEGCCMPSPPNLTGRAMISLSSDETTCQEVQESDDRLLQHPKA